MQSGSMDLLPASNSLSYCACFSGYDIDLSKQIFSGTKKKITLALELWHMMKSFFPVWGVLNVALL